MAPESLNISLEGFHLPHKSYRDKLLTHRFKALLAGTSTVGLKYLHHDWIEYQKNMREPSHILAKLITVLEARILRREMV